MFEQQPQDAHRTATPSGSDDTIRSWRAIVEEAVSGELDRLALLSRAFPGVAAELNRVSVVVELDAPEDDPDLLGLYIGVPLTDSGGDSGQLPPLVQVFLLPLVDLCTPQHFAELDPDLTMLHRESVITVRHELAHHFGFDHEALEPLGLL